MRISENIARLKARPSARSATAGRLQDLGEFGSNPGNLRGLIHVPEGLVGPSPLVVVLHGCTQDAQSYDRGSGWSRLADRHGFLLLFPEQQRSNNPNLCFNWYQPGDSRRDSGEPASIRQMIARLSSEHDVDPARIFVTGLSAGGAMASIMLAAYPEIFAGGAVIAGIAYGCAGSVGQAFQCMGGRAAGSPAALGDKVRRASRHKGPWPKISVWHGSVDTIVAASNGEDIVRQWLDVHGLREKPDRIGEVAGYPHRVWNGRGGEAVVEHYMITGMGHGTPLAPGDESGQSGMAGPHMLDAAISSTDRIASFWGIAETGASNPQPLSEPIEAPVRKLAPRAETPKGRRAPRHARKAPVPGPASTIQKVIEDALRAAGLMR